MDSYFVVDDRSLRSDFKKASGAQRKRVRELEEERSERVSCEAGAEGDSRAANNATSATMRSSEQGRREDALASGADEGRDKLR